ncbi:hypothetical protein GN956_G25027 [Arapaima gigas]
MTTLVELVRQGAVRPPRRPRLRFITGPEEAAWKRHKAERCDLEAETWTLVIAGNNDKGRGFGVGLGKRSDIAAWKVYGASPEEGTS